MESPGVVKGSKVPDDQQIDCTLPDDRRTTEYIDDLTVQVTCTENEDEFLARQRAAELASPGLLSQTWIGMELMERRSK